MPGNGPMDPDWRDDRKLRWCRTNRSHHQGSDTSSQRCSQTPAISTDALGGNPLHGRLNGRIERPRTNCIAAGYARGLAPVPTAFVASYSNDSRRTFSEITPAAPLGRTDIHRVTSASCSEGGHCGVVGETVSSGFALTTLQTPAGD
jgi:hypothetical protein